MATEMQNPELYVFEYGGTARSGKGTIVSWLSEVHPEIATEETGADYRAVTLGLLRQGEIELGMNEEQVATILKRTAISSLTDLVARRKELEADEGSEALYGGDVNQTVHLVSPLLAVRKAVKSGFAKRVERVRDDDEHSVLLVDGRNLGPVVEGIEGTTLVMRTFVTCLAFEAARRECLRAGLTPGTMEWNSAFGINMDAIVARNNADQDRALDPVIADPNAIDYWKNEALINATTHLYGQFLFEDDRNEAVQRMFDGGRDFTDVPRIGAGLKAVKQARQINFDTTPFTSYPNSKHAMLLAANTMFEEALRAKQILAG